MNLDRRGLHFVVNPAAFGAQAVGGAAVAASSSTAIAAAPNALAVCGASADASDNASDNDAADDAADDADDAARDLFGDFPDLPPVNALNAGDVVGDTVIICGLQIEQLLDVGRV
jgi:hypothetical protein